MSSKLVTRTVASVIKLITTIPILRRKTRCGRTVAGRWETPLGRTIEHSVSRLHAKAVAINERWSRRKFSLVIAVCQARTP